ncbi:hypothetical protein AQF52_0014 [Streptomyces venezuelae]|nr:hypothetical protein AQF52_0014 [Streptomyces venezuelae]
MEPAGLGRDRQARIEQLVDQGAPLVVQRGDLYRPGLSTQAGGLDIEDQQRGIRQ